MLQLEREEQVSLRNVVFILIDCLRADKCWGNNRGCATPNIDKLCSRGTTFSQAISTVPVTSPAVASLFTGLYPFTHGVRSLHGYKLRSGINTMADVFRDNGYYTCAEVTGPLMREIGIDRGFTSYNLRERTDNLYSSWFDKLLAKLHERELREPYFFFLHFFDIHKPRQIAPEYNNASYGNTKYERALSSLDTRLGKLLNCLDEGTIIIFHADHGEKIANTASQEKLIQILSFCYSRYKGLKKNIINTQDRIFFSGHGFNLYDYLLRVPLVFVGKGVFPEGQVLADQVRQIDIFPTIIEALSLKNSLDKIHGRSLLPLIAGYRLPEAPAYCEVRGPLLPEEKWLVGIRTSKYKYISAPYSTKISHKMYDLEKDPNEEKNIAHKMPDVAQELKNTLHEIIRINEDAIVKNKIKHLKRLGKI